MPEWNETESEGAGGFRKPRKSKPAGGKSSSRGDSRQAGNYAGGWQQGGKATTPDGSKGASWNAMEVESQSGFSGSQWRWLITTVMLAGGIIAGIVGLVVWVWNTPTRLPIYDVVMDTYSSDLIGDNPFQSAERKIWEVDGENSDTIEIRLRDSDNEVSKAPALIEQMLADPKDGLRRFLQTTLPGRSRKSGGPEKNHRVWMISAIAGEYQSATDSDPTLVLYRPTAKNNAMADPSLVLAEDGLPVGELLRQIAENTPEGEHGLVLLDLRSPPTVMDLQRIAPRWKTLAQAAVESEQIILKRLIVGIAASDGEVNWTAPELSGGVFKHFAKLGLLGKADAGNDEIVSVGELQDYVNQNVKSWVAARRNAIQSPSWFMSDRDKQTSETRQLVNYDAEKIPRGAAPPDINLETNWQRLLGLWKRHAAVKNSGAAISHPLELGALEAELILLQEMLERNSQSNWGNLVSRVEANLQRCQPSPRISSFTSLHETHAERDTESSRKAMDSWVQIFDEQSQPTSTSTDTSDAAEPTPLPKLTIDQLGWVCWTEIIRRARGSSANQTVRYQENARFDLEQAKLLLDAYETRAGSQREGIEYQEIHYLRLLLDEIDWVGAEGDQKSDSPADAVLDLCRCFDMLMESSGRYGLDSHRWLDPQLTDLEQRLMTLTDQLLGGRIPAPAERTALYERFMAITDTSRQLSRFCRLHFETIADLPHLLTWITRGHAVAQTSFLNAGVEADAYQARFERWKALLAEVENFSQWKAKQPDQNAIDGLLDSGAKLNALVTDLRGEWNRFSEALASPVQKEISDVNYRKFLIALRSPLTTPAHRERIFDKWSSFLSEYDGEKLDEIQARTTEPSTPGEGNPYTALWRKSPIKDVGSPLPEVYSGERPSEQILKGLMEDSGGQADAATIRHAALTLGHRYRRQPHRRAPREPWDDWVDKLQANHAKNRTRHWHAQGLRITRIAFGNGNSPDNLVEPYYLTAAKVYLQAIGEQNKASETYEDLNEKLQAKRDWIDDLRISWGAEEGITYAQQEQKRDLTISLQVGPAPEPKPPVLGSLRLIDSRFSSVDETSTPRRIAFADGRRADLVELLPDAEVPKIPVDLNYFRNQNNSSIDGELAFRGHHRLTTIMAREIGTDLKLVGVEYEPLKGLDTQVKVLAAPQPPLLEIMLLIDCSGSTFNHRIKTGERLDSQIRLEANKAIERFDRLHQDGAAQVRIGVMLFGLLDDPNVKSIGMSVLRRNLLQGDRVLNNLGLTGQNRNDEITVTRTDSLGSANWKSDLKNFISKYVEGSGNTPLYLAIDKAMDRLETGNRAAIQKIIVIGDGVNKLDRLYQGKNRSHTELITNLERKGLDKAPAGSDFGPHIDVLLYGNELNKEPDARRELDELDKKFGRRFTYSETNNFDEFVKKLEALFPEPKVSIGDAGSNELPIATGKLKESIPVPLDGAGPERVNVKVGGFSGISSTPQPLPLYVNQQAVLTLSNSGQRLVWHGYSQPPSSWIKWDSGDLYFDQRIQRHSIKTSLLDIAVAARPAKEDLFPERPRAVLAKLEQVQGNKVLGAFNLWDYQFYSHGSEANNLVVDGRSNDSIATETIRFGSVPWFSKPFERDENSINVPEARLTVWVSKEPLPAGRQLRVEPNEKLGDDVGEVHFEVDHRGESVIVTVTDKSDSVSPNEQASEAVRQAQSGSFDWIVRTAESESTTRRYSVDGSRAEHEIKLLREARDKPVVIEFQSFTAATKMMTRLRFEPEVVNSL